MLFILVLIGYLCVSTKARLGGSFGLFDVFFFLFFPFFSCFVLCKHLYLFVLSFYMFCQYFLIVDVSSAVMPGDFQCLVSQGYSSVVVRAYRSSGSVDTVAPHTIYNAVAGGVNEQNIDIYIFPCPRCSNAQAQIDDTLNYLGGYNANFTRLFLDIEDTASHSYWGTDTSSSQQFMKELYQAAVGRLGSSRVGIYASGYMWNLVFGDTNWNCCSNAMLWYADYSGGPSFSDFRSFGGWSSPVGKQYNGGTGLCNIDADLDYWA